MASPARWITGSSASSSTDTTHQVTNTRISIDGDTATMTALWRLSTCSSPTLRSHALLKNPYEVELRRDGDRWLISRMRIDNTWFTGDPGAIFA
ncbi:nuclear transport factor 2 family protein [Nocardia africana]|uniref:nuclear transport factor 2 family protein n=1 Tax=Nocardia africana TaxID=134964 RepID=UPI001C3FBA9C|nr:nuclear transport factor 2 family protein [Nocardia africana]MCC3313757.1 nuclear transport factor 2 family protein [Nocardia africana]